MAPTRRSPAASPTRTTSEWRQVRIAVLPYERCRLRRRAAGAGREGTRLHAARARDGDAVVGSGIADRSDSAATGSLAPRVLPEHRRRGVGTALLHRLVDHLTRSRPARWRGRPSTTTRRWPSPTASGFADIDHEVEQTFSVVSVRRDRPRHRPASRWSLESGAPRPLGGQPRHLRPRGARRLRVLHAARRDPRAVGDVAGWAARCSWPSTTARSSAAPGSSSTPT